MAAACRQQAAFRQRFAWVSGTGFNREAGFVQPVPGTGAILALGNDLSPGAFPLKKIFFFSHASNHVVNVRIDCSGCVRWRTKPLC
jgi:hypothetical protein